MIKVNLLRNIGISSVGTEMGTSMGGAAEIVSVDVSRQAAIKGFIIVLFPIIIWGYRSYLIDQLQARKTGIEQAIKNVETETSSFGSAGPRVKKAMDLKDKIQKEIKVIQEIAKFRLREVKALDQIQDIFRLNGIWLKEVVMENGRVNLQGYALGDIGTNDLLERLRGNVFFSNLETKGTTEEVHPTLGKIIKFDIDFSVGRQGE